MICEPDSLGAFARRLLDRLGDQVTGLESFGRLRYPVKTGVNRFFYPDAQTVARFGIEPEFCRAVLRSPRDVRTILLGPENVQRVLFACACSVSELEARGNLGALRYIKWGSHQLTAAGVPWSLTPSVRGRSHWYAVPLPQPADIICPRFFDRRFFFVRPEASLLEDQTFYGLVLHDGDPELRDALAAVLNCSLTYLFLEMFGRTGLGDGVRQYALSDMAVLPVVDPRVIARSCLPELTRGFRALASRAILPVDQEILQEDRVALDALVSEAVGIPATEMDTVRRTLVHLTNRRLARARSVRD